jgi:ribose transport system permease protein
MPPKRPVVLFRLRPPRSALGGFVRRWALLGFLILLIIVFSILRPDTFFTWQTAQTVLFQQTVGASLAIAVVIILIVGEYDLSVGYVLGFAAVFAAVIGGKEHYNGGITILLTLLAGAAIGALNGLLVTKVRINSLIATLGVGIALSGVSVGISGSQTLFAGIPHIIGQISSTNFLSVKSGVWLIAGVALIVYGVLAHTPAGRKMYAVGGSKRVARLAGIQTSVVKVAAFTVGGLLAALAGLLQLGQSGAADPTFGPNLLLPAFAAAFLGATSVRPGFFNIGGTIIAILVLAVGFTGLNLLGAPFWVQPIYDGFALLVGVVLAGAEAREMSQS